MVIISNTLNNFMYMLQELANVRCPVNIRGSTENYNYSACCQSTVTICITITPSLTKIYEASTFCIC